jgi:hypothetical protein
MTNIKSTNNKYSSALPIRLNRPSHSNHVPYSINYLSKSLASQVERHIVPEIKQEDLVEYGADPKKPAFSRKIIA